MTILKPKDFIQQVLIDEFNPIVVNHPYICFALMAIGIEFLGKCISDNQKWDLHRKKGAYFKKAIDELVGLRKYQPHKVALYEDLRCGFAHSFVPGPRFTLSSKNQAPHMQPYNNGINLRCEDFYEDFKAACNEVIERTYPEDDKMNRSLLSVPGETFSGSALTTFILKEDIGSISESSGTTTVRTNFPNSTGL